jgi:hypothetical protein
MTPQEYRLSIYKHSSLFAKPFLSKSPRPLPCAQLCTLPGPGFRLNSVELFKSNRIIAAVVGTLPESGVRLGSVEHAILAPYTPTTPSISTPSIFIFKQHMNYFVQYT